MGVSVCLASGKGGVGKSTIAANLGVALSKMGINTVLVDGDLEGASLGLLLGVDPGSPSIHDCLAGKMSCREALVEAYGTKVMVGSINIERLVDISLDRFPKVLAELTGMFDILLLDAPAGLGSDAITLMSSCHSLILVLTPDINSVTNTLKTLAVAKKVGVAVLGAIVSRTGGEYDIPSDQIEELMKVKIIAEMPEEELVKRSLNEAVPIYVGYPASTYSAQIKVVAKKLIGV